MSVTDELNRIIQAKEEIRLSIENKGVEVGQEVSLSNYPQYIDEIKLGVTDVKVNGVSVVQDDVALITVPTKLSDLQDDLDYTRIKVSNDGDISGIRIDDFIIQTEE